MTVTVTDANGARTTRRHGAAFALAAAILGFFVVTLDAVVVNVALPPIRIGLGGGIAGLQWVVDGYALMFAALLLSSGSLVDRVGARRALAGGMALFVLASIACGAAPSVGFLVAARFVQGAAAAVIMPATLTLISHAYPDKAARGRAVAMWAMGGSVASTSGPIVGGLLTLVDWRLIFFINVPVGALAFWTLRRTAPSPRRTVPFDWFGQVTAVVAMVALTYGAIEAGQAGLAAPQVIGSLGLAVLGVIAFVVGQRRVAHPMVPLDLFGSRTFRIALGTGFAFMVGYYGLPFLFSLYLQGVRGLNSFGTGVVFLPMMLIGLALTPFSARIVERVGARLPIATGLLGDDGRSRGPGTAARHDAAVDPVRADGAGRAGRPAGDAADDRRTAQPRTGAANGYRQWCVQHQPADRRSDGRGRLRRTARQRGPLHGRPPRQLAARRGRAAGHDPGQPAPPAALKPRRAGTRPTSNGCIGIRRKRTKESRGERE